MKIGLLSDTHGWLDPRIGATLSEADCIVHAGDVLGAHVLEQLEALSRQHRVVAVAGNNDRFHGVDLPEEMELSLPGGCLTVVHGDRFGNHPSHARLRQQWPQSRTIVYGHTHRIAQDQEMEPWVLNPGAAGRTRLHGGPSCMMLIAQSQHWEVVLHQFLPLEQEESCLSVTAIS